MSKYLVVERQNGRGCDYTIGCGIKYGYIDADSFEEAKVKALENADFGGEQEREQILIAPLEHVLKIDLDGARYIWEQEQKKNREEKQRLKDLEEFEKLKKKLGK